MGRFLAKFFEKTDIRRFSCAALPLALFDHGPYLDPEIDVLGFYLPFVLVIVTGGFLLAWAVAWMMDMVGLTRFVWHPPLFLFSLMVACSAGLGLILFPR
ncbi:MAG: DUF1656 domain-containing protein [Verrucomicrobiota bacterium]